jgi:hypothetical protein
MTTPIAIFAPLDIPEGVDAEDDVGEKLGEEVDVPEMILGVDEAVDGVEEVTSVLSYTIRTP